MKLKRVMLAAMLAGSMVLSIVDDATAQSAGPSSGSRAGDSSETDRDRVQVRDREQDPARDREHEPERGSGDSRASGVRVREVAPSEPVLMRRQASNESASDELEFQKFVNSNYGKWLPIFGRDAFNGADQGFDIPVSSTPSDIYEIGPGDEIRVKITGSVEMDANLVVDNTGFISLPRVGSILVGGVARRDLDAVVGRAVSRLYKNYALHVYTGALRTISIFVVGHAGRPGAYRVPATSSLVNALYAAGGVSPTGSLRAVKLMRGGKEVGVFDFYNFVAKGSTEGDQPLRNGDVVHIPAAGARVALMGASNVQAIFEISPSATTLNALLEAAGGLPSASRNESITVDRLDRAHPEAPKQVIALDLKALASDFVLQDGDVVMLHGLGSRYANMVSVRGNIYQPMRRAFRPGMRVTDLIPDATALYSLDTVRAQNDLALDVAAQRPRGRKVPAGDEPPGEAMVQSDNINWNLASIERRAPKSGQTELVHFNLGRALTQPGGSDDLELRPGDQVVIYGDRNLKLPEQLRNRFVRIEGEVQAAGVYQLQDGETLQQLIERAGGLTPRGFLYGIRFNRQAEAQLQREQMAKAASLLDDAIASQMSASLASDPTPQEKALNEAMVAEMRRRAELLKRQRPEGRITLDLPFNASVAELPVVPLEDGDVVQLPLKPQHLTIVGAVQNPLTTIWSPGGTYGSYVNSAVPKKSADLSEIYVIRANGRAEVIRGGSFFSPGSDATPQPGDTIYIPEKPMGLSAGASWMRGLRDWSMVIVQLLIGASVAKGL